jgi:hypothetical protein
MKTKYPRIFGLLAAVLLVASFVVPVSLMSPAPVQADPGICKWDALMTPGYLPLKNDLALGSDITDMAVGGDGATILLTATNYLPGIYNAYIPCVPNTGTVKGTLYWSNNGGISFTSTKGSALNATFWTTYGLWTGGCPPAPAATLTPNVYSVAIAPDNPNFWAVTTDDWDVAGAALITKPVEVWITEDAGSSWDKTNLRTSLFSSTTETIRTIDISADYGGKRDIVVGTTDGNGGGDLYIVKSTGFTGWQIQNVNSAHSAGVLGAIDFFAAKFSPTYGSDASLAVVFADVNGTWYNTALRDIDTNTTSGWAKDTSAPNPGVEVAAIALTSPTFDELRKADLELPSDFSGQAASLRRAYISLDATASATGIFRIDDTTLYTLMATTGGTSVKQIYSIAYFGTYASGKLLAGERYGYPCTATVPTWFTDSPTTCPIPCWYPALKPTTGAATLAACASPLGKQEGDGGAVVGWRADGQIAFAGTGANLMLADANWYSEWAGETVVARDESAFAISRNNGETWNQISLIDTVVSKFTDVAPTPDCKTVYLASISTNTTACSNFDSVWRSSSNINVTSPYSPLPVGTFWERVLARQSQTSCNMTESTVDLLRLVPYCADPTGQIVVWAAQGTKAQAWSPDFGDYWANITPRDTIQDFCLESSTVLYNLSAGGKVQKLPYTGTAWSTTLPSVDSIMYAAHSIAAYPEGKVLVGAAASFSGGLYAASFSSNFNTDNPSFAVMSLAGKTSFGGDVHPAFDPNFKDSNIVFINDMKTGVGGSVYRNNVAAQLRWADTDMMAATNGAVGCYAPHQVPQTGLVIAFTGQALYSSHGVNGGSDNISGVCRTIDDGTGKYGPFSGMPKPGVAWDCLKVFVSPPTAAKVSFTLEPTALKACGCCTLDTDTTLYAIDGSAYGYIPSFRTGLVWAFTDCLAKKGPALITEDKTLIGCDPVSGRAQEVNFCWEQLCVANTYDIEISKNADFTIKVIDWLAESSCYGFEPADVTAPCAFFPAGGQAITWGGPEGSAIASYGNLECGHTYYWRVKARSCATTQVIRSPWSEVRSFTVKAGLPVVSTYLGLTLLAPNNGCLGCPIQPVSFSWSPFKETTKYKFQLASDAGMTQLVKEAEVVNSTAYEFDGALDYSTNYFWRVMSMEPAPSDWSATFSFQTEAKPAATAGAAPVAPTPLWVWVVIAIGAILVIVTLVLIFKTRRV